MKQDEIFPLVDEEGNVIGKAPRNVCHNGSKLLHPVVHLHIFNRKSQLYLQKRSQNKDIQPGKWDTAVGGHVDLDETADAALKREAFEELGITNFQPVFFHKYIFESEIERELVYSYYTLYDGTFIMDSKEVEESRYWTWKEIETGIESKLFTPNFEFEYKTLNLSSLPGKLFQL
jgi:Isopentenyldiphosphate isomerase